VGRACAPPASRRRSPASCSATSPKSGGGRRRRRKRKGGSEKNGGRAKANGERAADVEELEAESQNGSSRQVDEELEAAEAGDES
jgi:hypothetical protein